MRLSNYLSNLLNVRPMEQTQERQQILKKIISLNQTDFVMNL